MLDHERLHVHNAAREFNALASGFAPRLIRVRPDLADHLQRASASIALNIAEGAGEFSRKDWARFYRIARRSAAECAAILDLAVDMRLLSDRELVHTRELLARIAGMLTRMVQNAQSHPAERRPD